MILSHAGMGRVSGFVPLVVDTGTPQRLTVGEASEDFLETYGITPILGRGIQADDTRDGAPARRTARPRLLAAGNSAVIGACSAATSASRTIR